MKKEIINVDTNKNNKNKKDHFSRSSSYSKPIIKFIFESGNELSFDKNTFLLIKPILSNNNNLIIKQLKNNNMQINLQNNITHEDLSLFLDIIKYLYLKENKNKIVANIDKSKIMKIFNISDLFMSENFNMKFIKDILLKINYDDTIFEIIFYSYKKLCIYSEKKEEINNYYFDLFYQSLENISKKEQIVFNNLDKIKILDKKIIDEIIEKTFKNLIYANTILIEDNEEIDKINEEYESIDNNNLHIITINQLNKLIQFLIEINSKKNNFFDLITSEYAFLLSKDSILELKNLPHPSLQADIHFSDYSFYCQEFPLDMILNHKKIVLIVSYKTEDHSFNINIKLKNHRINKIRSINNVLEMDKISEEKYIEDNSCFKIFTFLTHIMITKGPEKIIIATQNNLLSLSDSKTVYNILKISNFDNELRNFLIREPEKEYFSVIVQIKLCYKYSALASYLLRQFKLYYNDKNICKISKQLLMLILENKFLKINNNNEMVTTILLWLDDEMNIKEDISSIFGMIKWEEVDESLIFELIIKYSHIIVGNKNLEKIFINVFEKKYNNNIAVLNILKTLFSVGAKIEYNKLFTQMKISQKNNEIYKYFNSDYNFKYNHFFEYDNENSSFSKDSSSIKEDLPPILSESINKKNKKYKIKNYTLNNSINDIEEKKITIENDLKKSNNQIDNFVNKINKENYKNKNQKNKSNNSLKVINKINQESETILKKYKENNNKIKSKTPMNIFNKNMPFIPKDQMKKVKNNINKNQLKVDDNKKIGQSYIKNMKKVLKDKPNINSVSININNINNINISNNNFPNYKNQNKISNNKYNDYINTNSFSLTFCSNKNQQKTKNKNNYIKNTFKLFSTSNNDKNNIYNYTNKKNNNELKLDNLLSNILKYDKTLNRSKQKYGKKAKIKNISANKKKK